VLIGKRTPPLEWSESGSMRFTLGVLLVFVGLGLADRHVDLAGQMGLGAATWVVLLVALWRLPLERRVQTLLVVAVATCMEVVGSILWGVYSYRLHNLPMFVPPGHGLVYLAGISLSQTTLVRARPRGFVAVVAACAAAWGLLGLTALPRFDLGGAIGVSVFLFFLWRGRAPAIYGGVFFVVLFLEIWGTAVGLWQWHAVTPGLGLPMGNPPSGAMSGYVLFDIVAIAVTAALRRAPVPAQPRRDQSSGRPAQRCARILRAAAFPSRTDDLFVWTVTPAPSAQLLAAMYGNGDPHRCSRWDGRLGRDSVAFVVFTLFAFGDDRHLLPPRPVPAHPRYFFVSGSSTTSSCSS
jgi:hypothetical protein